MLAAAAICALAVLGWQFKTSSHVGAAQYTVVTDEGVYSAGDAVTITGTGYLGDTSYDIVVTRPDASVVDGSGTETAGYDSVVSDVDGNISYVYTLTNPAPDGSYTVDVFDSSDLSHSLVLASTDFYDDTPYALTITQTVVGLQVTVSGTWKWDGCVSKSNANKHPGFAIDWGDGTGTANPSPPPATSRDGVYPTNNGSWVNCAPPGTGNWGTLTHTYASSVDQTICVIMYHVAFHGTNPPSTSGEGSINPWSNHDNSIEEYPSTPSKQQKCTPVHLATSTPTRTATRTNTPIPTSTKTSTPLPTSTKTNTPLPTSTKTNTPLPTSTNTPLPTSTNTPLPTSTKTNTPLPTSTNTPLPTSTNTPLPTATKTSTPLPTSTNTPLPTSTNTATATFTATATNTPLPTATKTSTPLPTSTNTATATFTATATNTPLPTATNTPLPTATNTPLPTATNTPLPTATNTPLPTATNTPLPTATNTPLPTATNTPLPTATNTPLPTATNTPLPTATNTPLPTATNTPLPTATNTPQPTVTNTAVPTSTDTATATFTPLPSSTNTPQPTATFTTVPTATFTAVATATDTATATNTPQPTSTNTPDPTQTFTPLPTTTNTPQPTATNTPQPTATNTPQPTATNTPQPTATNTPQPTATNTPLPTATNTPLPTATKTPQPTATNTANPTTTSTAVATATSSPVATATSTPNPTATSLPAATPTNVSATGFNGIVKSANGLLPPVGGTTTQVNLWVCSNQATDGIDNNGDSTVDNEPPSCLDNGEGSLDVSELLFSSRDCDTRNDDDDGDGKPVDGSVADGSTSPYVGSSPRPECAQPTLQDYNQGLVDKNGGELPEGLGGFEFQVKFDHKVFDLTIIPSTAWTNGRSPNCSMTVITENDIRYGCVSTGTGLGLPQAAGQVGATLHLTYDPDMVERIVATKDDGVVRALLDENCEITDTLGDIFPNTNAGLTTDCTDIDITVRRLEGDVNQDCVVGVEDEQLQAFRYGSFFGHLSFDRFFDLEPWPTGDFDIDIKDLQFVFGREGSSCTQPVPDNQDPQPANGVGQP